ncbi:MAG: EAL domain-containing protein [Firmicutes bacterium]|jgi:diguanylate cyclase (GGDEF)-like protein|nr:EAL domain-containing protein [Bacillota bacterium]
MKKRIFIIALCLFLYGYISFADNLEKRVLYISSYSPSFVTFDEQLSGIKSVLGEDYIIDVEFMDTKRFYTDENIDNFYRSLKYKLDNQDAYDGIIVGDDNGLNFVMEYQEDLFDEIPIVFLGVNDLVNAKLASDKSHVTGVVEKASYYDTIRIAQRINPLAEELVIITDNTVSGKSDLKNLLGIIPEVKDLEYRLLDTSNITFEEMCNEIRALDNRSILLLSSLYGDVTGKRISFDEGLQMIIENSRIPLYHPYNHGMGDGVLGGRIVSHYEQGKTAAQFMQRVFKGEDISKIHYANQSPNKYIFDYDVMKKFSISKDIIPEDAVLINYEVPLIIKYLKIVILTIIVISIELFIIIFLKITLSKKKKAEKELYESNGNLKIANEDLIAANEELTATFEELENQNRKIHELIYIDNLTGLSNRYAIFKDIDKCLSEKNKEDVSAIMFLDVDNFKDINDSFGHDMGDQIIKKTGEKLKDILEDHIKVGRFGGDEFIITVSNSDRENIEKIITNIKNIFSDEIIIREKKMYLTVSIGVVLYPEHGSSREELIKKADLALYRAKESGKNTYVIFEEEMDVKNQEDIILQGEINEAFKNREFYLNYQPIFRSNKGDIYGFEALIRWNSKSRGMVSPYTLIKTIEKMGGIVDVGEWVARESFRYIKELNEKYKREYKISINISILQLKNNDFYSSIVKIADEVGLEAKNIILEVTETSVMESFNDVNETLMMLKEKGFNIALDDFGSGYSSLKYLKELPIDLLKIDKYFVDDIVESEYSNGIVSSMVKIAHAKGIETVAEGIEEIYQFEALRDQGCDYIQGYYFSKPLSEDDLEKFIENR